MSKYPQKNKTMKKVKNIALALIAASALCLTTSCSTSRTAADEYRQYLSERPDVAEKLALESETTVVVPEVVEDSLSATAEDISSEVGESILSKSERRKLTDAENVVVDATADGANIDVKIDARGSQSEARKHSFLEGKYDRIYEPVYESKGKTSVDLGKESDLFTQNGKMFWYDAPKKELHQIEHVGDHVVAEHKTTGLFVAPFAGALFYNHDVNPFVGGVAGYNVAKWTIYGFYTKAFNKTNEDDVNPGKGYTSSYWGVRLGYRIDLSPRGSFHDRLVLTPFIGWASLGRELTSKEDVEIEVPEGTNYQFSYDDTDYKRGGVSLPHIGFDISWRIGKRCRLFGGGAMHLMTDEYHKGHSTSARGNFAYEAHVGFSINLFTGWKRVAPNLGGIIKKTNKAAKDRARLQRTLNAL